MQTQAVNVLRVDLNPQLEETKPYRITTVDDLGKSIASQLDPKSKSLVRNPSIPSGAEVHGSFLYTLSDAYSLHQSVSFGPHDLWYVLLTEIARMVNATPDEFRTIFTKSSEKIEILVETGDPTYLPMDRIISELTRLVPVDLSLFLPEFTTHTDQSRVACMAAFADAVKSYYDYSTYLCGIKALEIRGTVNDWEMFGSHVHEVKHILGAKVFTWLSNVERRIINIIESLQGGETEFYKDIFSTTRIGSGGELLVNGWFGTEFFRERGSMPKIDNYPNTWSLVPFKNIETNRSFTDAFGCFYSTVNDGFRTPQYSNFTFEI
jgi:hypothetical protein